MKIRQRSEPVNHDRWLVSYADFVTLLFAFFVVLYATAQVDRQRAVRLSDAIRSAFQELGVFQKGNQQTGSAALGTVMAHAGASQQKLPATAADEATGREQFDAIRNELERALADEIKHNDVALHMEADRLVVSLREMGFFDSGSATIKQGAEDAFGRVARILGEHSCSVRIEGHTDNVPIHTSQFASNWELSTARATGLVKLLIEQHGISAGRLSAAGYAEFHPVSANDNAKGRQLNRRVDVVILRSGSTQTVAEERVSAASIKASMVP
jgi:chemotaxis protein MotB